MSIAQKSLAIITTFAVAAAIVFSFVATIQVAQAATVCPHTWATNLKMGSSGADVMALQQFLNSDPATMVASTGAGSPGMESMYFGGLTKAAVIKFQNKYASDILAPNGLTVGNGNVFASTRAKANMLCSGTTTTTPAPATGTGVAINAGTQPMNALSPAGASRVPFTRFTLTAGNDGDVVVNSIQVQRTGLGQDAAFQGVILVDEATGLQVGTAKTFNSNHQAAIGQTMTIARGTTKTFLVAGNMASSLTSYAGEAPSLSVVGVNTSATVSGSLPIVGANNTNNATLTVGSVTLNTSNAFASNANATKEIGTTGYKQTGLRLTAGSTEDVRLKSLTFYQTGSASGNDISNVVVVVNGTSYPTTVSADGRYYMASLGSGVVIAKGNQVDAYIQYDVTGSNSSGRTVMFDVDRNTDIFGTGETYNYGISPAMGSVSVPGSRGTLTITNGSPFVYSTQTTISGASVTSIAKANEVPAQNIAINLSNQPLGGYIVDIKGENMTVQQTVFTVASSSGSGAGLLTNVTVVDENGAVVAGPVDAAYTSSSVQTITFSDTITYKTGRHVFTLRGKVSSTINGGTLYTATTNPSSSSTWVNVRGETSGNTISLSGTSSFSMNQMTVKAGSLVIGPSSSLTSQSIVPGGQAVELGRMAFDAGQSGEDVRISSIPARLTWATGAATELTSCQIFNGATSLTTGSNTVNPSGTSPVDATFTLDNPLTITKGSVVTVSVKCNVSGSATNNATYSWAPGAAAFITSFTVTGAVSGTTVTATSGSGTAATFTISTGSMTATASGSAIAQPSRTFVAAGSTGVTVGYIKMHATNEAVNLTKVGLTLANGLYGSKARGDGGSSASGAGDVVTAYIYNGATMVGSATFNGTQVATSTFNTPVNLAKDADTTLTIKVDLAAIGVSSSGGIGDLVKVDPLNAEGTGASSGSLVQIGATSGVSGVQLVKSYPTVALGTGACTGNGCNGSNQIVKVMSVTANASGPVSVYQTVISVATSSAMITNGKLFVYDQSGNQLSSSAYGASAGQFGSTACASGCASNTQTWTFTGTIPVQIPAGTTYMFKLLGTVAPNASATNWSIIPTIQGDSAVQINLGSAPTYVATSTANVSSTNFIWSDNATTTAVVGDVDWFNGFQVPGLSGTGL